jgi:hypothetical protein
MKNSLRDIKTNDQREKDNIATFIIFCEDGIHEPAYFKSFEVSNTLKVNPIPKQGQGWKNLINTLAYCSKNGLLEFKEGKYSKKEGVTEEIWCVYDRDKSDNNHGNDVAFTTAISTTEDSGIKVAWSNDAFELWILLHFDEVAAKHQYNRQSIYSRLTDIFKGLADPALANLIVEPDFSYVNKLKRRPNFEQIVIPILRAKDSIAIDNAKQLEESYTHKVAFHDRTPCTMVHTLVEELLKYSEDIPE